MNGVKYIAISEELGWNLYKIINDTTMSTTPLHKLMCFNDCKIWESKEITRMGEDYLKLKTL